ncbi:MAG: hypothetical protein RBU30_01715 [Polyangia bacterium]|nr:hypothetical protein [Polyangia bacterium]
MCRAISRAGHRVTRWELAPRRLDGHPKGPPPLATHFGPLEAPPAGLEGFETLILIGAITGVDEPLAALGGLVGALAPETQVMLLEPAASGAGGRWLGRVIGRFRGQPLLSEATALAALGLGIGLKDLVQLWPQGLRSVVLTAGRLCPTHARRAP